MLKKSFPVSMVALIIATVGLANSAMASSMLIIHHKVADYAKWRPMFDADKKLQEEAGLTNARVLQSVGHPNNLTLVFDMADVAKAKALVTSKGLKHNMAKGGVVGKPEMFFVTSAP